MNYWLTETEVESPALQHVAYAPNVSDVPMRLLQQKHFPTSGGLCMYPMFFWWQPGQVYPFGTKQSTDALNGRPALRGVANVPNVPNVPPEKNSNMST